MTHEERALAILKSIARHSSYISIADTDNIEYLITHFKELIETEREACAKIAEKHNQHGGFHTNNDQVHQSLMRCSQVIAQAILARCGE